MAVDRGDVLLFGISARREMSWRAFAEMLDMIFVPDDTMGSDAAQVRSAVAALGASLAHWEVVTEARGTRLCIAPPVLARLPVPGLPIAVLCGSRSPDTLPTMLSAAGACQVTVRAVRQEPRHTYTPTVIEVAGRAHDQLEEFATALGIAYRREPAAWGLALDCGSIDGYMDSLIWSADDGLNWPRRRFDSEQLRFVPVSQDAPLGEGLQLIAYEHPSGWTRQDRIWRASMFAIADRGWGRFAVLAEHGTQVLRYDLRAGTVSVPRYLPMPSVAGRVLALCSGRPPAPLVHRGQPELAYGSVPWAIAETVLSKLGQHDPSMTARNGEAP